VLDGCTPRSCYVATVRPPAAAGDASFVDPVPTAPWRELSSTYVVCARDESLPVQLQRDVFAPRASDVVELDCGHSPFYSRPEQVAALIAARED
jgi:pimeloyl-ACP methyl ester carboxylesterase